MSLRQSHDGSTAAQTIAATAAPSAAGTQATATALAQRAAQLQHLKYGSGQLLGLGNGSEPGGPPASRDRRNAVDRYSTGRSPKVHPGPVQTTAPGEQSPAVAPVPKAPRSRRSGRRRKSSGNGAMPNGSESDSDDEDDDELEDAAAPNFGGVARKAQQICSDALRRLQQTARWSPEGLAALDRAFASIVQVG